MPVLVIDTGDAFSNKTYGFVIDGIAKGREFLYREDVYKRQEIVDLLQKHFGEVKKHMTALNEEELDVIFEHYTQAREVESLSLIHI